MSDNTVLSAGISDSDKKLFLQNLVESGGPDLMIMINSHR